MAATLPPHMTRAILLRSVNSNHSTDHLQAGHYAQATHPDYGQLWCFAAFPERGRMHPAREAASTHASELCLLHP